MQTTSLNGQNPTLCPNSRNSAIIFHGPASKSQQPGRTPTSHHYGRNPTSTVCHCGRQPNCLPTSFTVNSQLTLFQSLQILGTITSRHDVIYTPAPISYLGFIMTIVIVISFARERKTVPSVCVPELRAE